MKKKQFAVIGLGTFGSNVARELAKHGAEVLAIDINEEFVKEIAPFVAQAVVADATDEKVLKNLAIEEFDTAIVSVGENIETSILVNLLLKELGVKNVIVKCVNSWHSRIAAKIGADRTVFPEVEMAKKLAESLSEPNILDEIELSKEYNIVEMVAPKSFWGKTILASGIRSNYSVSVIAIKRKTPIIDDNGQTDIKDEIIAAPGPEDEIMEDDILLFIGREKDLEKMKNALY